MMYIYNISASSGHDTLDTALSVHYLLLYECQCDSEAQKNRVKKINKNVISMFL